MAARRPENNPTSQRLEQQLSNLNWFNFNDYYDPPVTLSNHRTTPYPNHPAPSLNPAFPGYLPQHETDPNPRRSFVRRDRKTKKFRKRFLTKPVQEIRGQTDRGFKNRWTGMKILGQGGNGIVGMWEFDGPEGSHISNLPTQVVMKEQITRARADLNLDEEGEMNWEATARGSSHILSLLLAPPKLQVPPAAGFASRLVMEYCPMGSLDDLIWKRHRQGVPFTELTLWLFFDCLVDAIAVMSEGSEYVYDNITRTATIANPAPNWHPMVHFDIKSPNVLLADDKMSTHADAPILKIADFGHAIRIDSRNYLKNGEDRWQAREGLRNRGTPGYYAPEQFSTRWNHDDWNATNPRVCGIYGGPTNIWGVGVVMFELIHLIEGGVNPLFSPPIAWDPRTINYLVSGIVARGLTYGETIRNSPYSMVLNHLVLECLYEVPAHRPTLARLKAVIKQEIANRPRTEVETWEDFDTPEEPPSEDEDEDGDDDYVPPLKDPPQVSRKLRRRR